MQKVDKTLVGKRFARSLETYSEQAVVQRVTAGKMLDELIRLKNSRFSRVFEVGCGSGILTRMIAERLDTNKLFANDLVADCRNYVENICNAEFFPGDIEQLDNLPGDLNLIISNATFQWLHHFEHTLEKMAGLLAKDGILAFSTFGPENVRELSQVKDVSLNYLSGDQLSREVDKHYEVIFLDEDVVTVEFSDPMAVLKHLKNTGTNSLSDKIWTKSALKKFATEYYTRYRTKNGVSLTYHPVIVIARKKNSEE